MFKNVQNRKGFTLIELMIVVAIIGILAAIAIPAFVKYLKQTKTTEVKLNLKALGDGASAYYQVEHYDGTGQIVNRQFPTIDGTANGAGDDFFAVTPPGTRVDVPADKLTSNPWKALKFAPTKPLYYNYRYRPTNADDAGNDAFFAIGEGNLDGDAEISEFRINSTSNAEGELTITPVFLVNPENELE